MAMRCNKAAIERMASEYDNPCVPSFSASCMAAAASPAATHVRRVVSASSPATPSISRTAAKVTGPAAYAIA